MTVFAQTSPEEWTVTAENFIGSDYYGITAANGMIGLVSSPEPFKVKETVLAGVYDYFGRGRVLNFLPNISPVNLVFRYPHLGTRFYHLLLNPVHRITVLF